MNLLSPAALAYLRAHDPQAGRLSPPRQLTRYAPRVVIANRPSLLVSLRELYGRGAPAGA